MEDWAEMQDRRIEELENHDHTMKVPATDTAAASTITENSGWIRSSKLDLQFAKMKAAIQKMADTVLSQATSVDSLTNHVAKNGGRGGRKNGGGNGQPKVVREKHICANCKIMVWHKDSNCPEYKRKKGSARLSEGVRWNRIR